MKGFDPGEGWREVPMDVALRAPLDTLCFDGLNEKRYWIREEPVPLLPIEPYTVIRITTRQWPGGAIVCFLNSDGIWVDVTTGSTLESEVFYNGIPDFMVLSEPRAVTAKAVLDRIASEPWAREVDLKKWRFDFEVDS